MDKNKLRILIISSVMGLAAAMLFYVYIQQEKAKIEASKPVVPAVEEGQVLMATRNIGRSQAVDRNDVVIRRVPMNFIQPGALSSVEEAAGKMVLVEILAGEQISSSKLSAPESFKGLATTTLSMITPPGKRAITIPMEPLMAVGGMVRPGDYVDILASFNLPQAVGAAQTVTATLFQNVLVLAVGNQLKEVVQAGRSSGRGEASEAAQAAQTITFALPPQEAELISFAQEQGRLKLILRPPLDTQTHALPVASSDALWQYILSMQGINMPQAEQQAGELPQGVEQKPSVEVYRGGRK